MKQSGRTIGILSIAVAVLAFTVVAMAQDRPPVRVTVEQVKQILADHVIELEVTRRDRDQANAALNKLYTFIQEQADSTFAARVDSLLGVTSGPGH